MKRLFAAATLVWASLTAATAQQPAVSPASPAPSSASGLQLDALDKTADACTDFYQFACGGWIAKNPVPSPSRWPARARIR